MSDEARQAMEEITKTIADHAGEFSDEELEQLVKVAEEGQAAVPDANMSVDDLKRALKSKGRGQKSAPGQERRDHQSPQPPTDKPASPDLPEGLRKRLMDDKAASEIVEEIAVSQGSGVKVNAAFVEALLTATRTANPPLTVEEAKEIMSVVTVGKGEKPVEVLNAVRERIAERPPTAGSTGGGAPTGPAPITSSTEMAPGQAPQTRRPPRLT